MRTSASCLALSLAAWALSAVAAEPLDGNAWRSWDEHSRRVFVLGALDGAELGATVAVFGCNLKAEDQQQRACNEATINAYRAGQQRYLQGLTPEQFMQGLDALYSDPQNRAILLRAGLQAVVYQAGGLPDPQSLIDAYRHRAP